MHIQGLAPIEELARYWMTTLSDQHRYDDGDFAIASSVAYELAKLEGRNVDTEVAFELGFEAGLKVAAAIVADPLINPGPAIVRVLESIAGDFKNISDENNRYEADHPGQLAEVEA